MLVLIECTPWSGGRLGSFDAIVAVCYQKERGNRGKKSKKESKDNEEVEIMKRLVVLIVLLFCMAWFLLSLGCLQEKLPVLCYETVFSPNDRLEAGMEYEEMCEIYCELHRNQSARWTARLIEAPTTEQTMPEGGATCECCYSKEKEE